MLSIDDITTLDIESINNCNAKCPLCLRAQGIKTNDSLDWDQVINQTTEKFWKQLQLINFNGSTGDNIMHPKIYEILEWVMNNSPAEIIVNTNGSIRDVAWWAKLGSMFKNSKHKVVFGIDGLANTHEIYRVGTSWQKVIDNAQAFINNGGNAEWQFILFDHNYNEVKECYQMSLTMGFKHFKLLYQDRFDKTNEINTLDEQTNEINTIKKFTGDLSQFQKYGLFIKTSSQSMEKVISTSAISCRSQNIGWISIYADGTIWPCCWLMGWHRVRSPIGNFVQQHMFKILKIELSAISLYSNSLQDIIDGEIWQKMYPESFKSKPNLICLQQCSKK